MPRSKTRRKPACRTATHRPAARTRRFQFDDLVAVDLFSGFGGLTKGIEEAGFTTIMAANHNDYKIDIHEANHPHAEHWRADLVDPESSDYHSAADLPKADLLVAGISCTSHSGANTKKAYALGLTLFQMDEDPEYEERVTRSERDRATALCVLTYARKHRPRMILVECTTEFQSWGPARLDRPTVGDGTTYRWWLNELNLLNYDRKIMYLNSMFFGVGQSRDRYYAVFWDRSIPAPDLEHRPVSWCASCDEQVEAVWTWRTGVPPTGTVRYGTQYNYRCPRCRAEVVPPMTPSLGALDLTNLGTRIGDRDAPLAATTMARAERCRARFPDFPAVLMPAKAMRGVERHLWQPMSTQTSQQEAALLSTGLPTGDLVASSTALTGHVIAAHRHNGDGQHITRPMDTVTSTHEKAAVFAAIDNFQGVARGLDQPLPTQPGSETLALVAAGVMPFRKHTTPTIHGEAMPTVTADQAPGLLTAAGQVAVGPDVAAQWRAMLGQLAVEDLYFRMLLHYEVGRGCGFDTSFPGRPGTFKVWGSARHQIDGYGNAVSPQVGMWFGLRLRDRLHGTPQGIKIPAPRVPVG